MFFTTKQVAARLNMPIGTLRRHLREGSITCGARPGGRIYVFSEKQLEEAERLLEEGGHHEVATTNDERGAS
jgi:excisionase family DNA binding protein